MTILIDMTRTRGGKSQSEGRTRPTTSVWKGDRDNSYTTISALAAVWLKDSLKDLQIIFCWSIIASM